MFSVAQLANLRLTLLLFGRPPESSLALAKKRLSALHTSVQQHEVETMDDDMMPLLSSNRELSQEELYEVGTRRAL